MNKPQTLLVIMGISGSGKSTLAKSLADTLSARYLDGDDFHIDLAKQMMAQNQQITDTMRQQWVSRIITCLTDIVDLNPVVLAFSGLKSEHRDALRTLPFKVVFYWLNASPQCLVKRIQHRENHFVKGVKAETFVRGQLDAMQPPKASEMDVINLDAQNSIADIQQNIIAHYHEHLSSTLAQN